MMRQAGFGSLVAVMVVGFSAAVLSAQQVQQPQPGKALQFEVAAIKPGDPNFGGSGSRASGGRFELTNVPLKQWVEQALVVSDYALKAPAWLDTARFDLNAKLPADAPKDHYAVPEMLRALLVERFGLKWHEEHPTVPGYELVPDKKVLLKSLSPDERLPHGSGTGPTSFSGSDMTMAEFAERLGTILGKPVVDATHLSDGYDIKLSFRAVNDAAVDRAKGYGMTDADIEKLPSIFDAVREQLGLRLQPAKVPAKVIVVDSINREPTAN